MKNKLQNISSDINLINRIFIFVAAIVLVFGFVVSPSRAEDNDVMAEINKLQLENQKNNENIAKLEDQAVSYEDAIKKLASKIEALQAKIDENTVQKNRLEAEIKVHEKELNIQKKLLGYNVRAIYLNSDMDTLEMLASSKDISDFVDKEQYRNAVQAKIQTAVVKVQTLRLKLKSQKDAVDLLIKDQKIKQFELERARKKQDELLSMNLAERERFDQQSAKNREKISKLVNEQRRANLVPEDGYYFIRFDGDVKSFNPNDYPYKNRGFSMQLDGCVVNKEDETKDTVDRWGYCTRQCTSYAAWAVEASGRTAPKYWGNAKDWVVEAYKNGVPVFRTPKPGDIAINTSGEWGHAMYVEKVIGEKFITSEYNTNLDGFLYTNIERVIK